MMRTQGDGLGLPRVPHGFVPAAEPAARFGSLAPITVFRAPRGWGKTATATAWLRSLGPEYEFAWVSVRGPITAAQFWDLVSERLADLGLHLDLDDHAHCDQVLAARERDLVLAVDNLHLVSDPAVDEALVDAVVHIGGLYVMALSRTERSIETLAPIEADGVVFRVQHLRLQAVEVHEVAGELGADVTTEQAAELTSAVGGWPALVRATFAGPSGPSESGDVINSYLQVVLRDPSIREVIGSAMRLAVADELDEEIVRLLGYSVGLTAAMHPLVEAGLTGEDGRLTAVVRSALAASYAELDPAAAEQAHARLSRWYEQKGDISRALRHALHAGDADRCRRILLQEWLRLADDPELVREVAASLGSVSLDEDPRTWVLSRQSGATVDAGLMSGPPPPGEVGAALPSTLAQWGLARLGAGELADGEEALRDALDRAESLGQVDVAQQAVAGLAFGRAMAGAVSEAEEWLRTCRDDLPATAGLVRVAKQLVALDSMTFTDEDIWPDLSTYTIGTPPPPAEITVPAGLELIETALAVTRELNLSSPVPEHSRMLELRLHRLAGVEYTLARTVLVKVLTTVFLAGHQLERCRELLAFAESTADATERWLRHRLAFYAGDFTGVLGHDRGGGYADPDGLLPRFEVEIILLRACALHRLDRIEEAADTLHSAMLIAHTHGLVRPYLLVPRGDLEAIATLVPQMRELLGEPPLLNEVDLFGLPAPVVELSRGELRVLEAIAEGQPVVAVASRLFVSANTVKSQLRAIYRKLGVHDRQRAVDRARELRLLPAAPDQLQM
ncbi:helix-turn-helix transcriptional regulator [Ruania zhangjianzhongii]|uniref:helix-turn-helix transcriptional regulator n=1 Tax=Ruania zhangjianzhongii TaxID=2603206 RepID=UPI0011CBDF45|nr:LuxR C-terminal-related transcriptional regulator [Ruania zhangjianzhongii]